MISRGTPIALPARSGNMGLKSRAFRAAPAAVASFGTGTPLAAARGGASTKAPVAVLVAVAARRIDHSPQRRRGGGR
jgi:hypothetical protein